MAKIIFNRPQVIDFLDVMGLTTLDLSRSKIDDGCLTSVTSDFATGHGGHCQVVYSPHLREWCGGEYGPWLNVEEKPKDENGFEGTIRILKLIPSGKSSDDLIHSLREDDPLVEAVKSSLKFSTELFPHSLCDCIYVPHLPFSQKAIAKHIDFCRPFFHHIKVSAKYRSVNVDQAYDPGFNAEVVCLTKREYKER